ncbi:MAG TPA: hypothetical protein VHG32_11735 [Thermoanaerobaculia bacterium]|nr:hypothetical protein [Thermoanaerobaculia bacterium]
MRGFIAAGATALLVLAEQNTSVPSDPPPTIAVVAHLEGKLFAALGEREHLRLRHDIALRFTYFARQRLPCMTWVEVEPGPRAVTALDAARATLFVYLRQLPEGLSSSFHLSLSATVRAGSPVPQMLGGWADWPVQSYLDYKGHLDRLQRSVDDFMAAHLWTDAFEREINAHFIRQVPIADRIAVDAEHRRLIVPLDAERLRLADGSRILVELTAPFCRGNLERCTLVLVSRGPVYGGTFHDQLQCEVIERRDCCTKETWTADLPDQIARALPGSVHVFLDAAHRHCPYGIAICSGEDGLFRKPSAQ